MTTWPSGMTGEVYRAILSPDEAEALTTSAEGQHRPRRNQRPAR